MERFAAALLIPTKLAWIMSPISVLLNWVPLISAMDRVSIHIAGVAIIAAGIVFTSLSQFAMGNSWRVGIDPKHRTALVTSGPFRWVRNPIYDGLLVFAAGNVFLIPTWLSLSCLAMLVICIEVQVRAVEEPYLVREHGEAYLRWAANSGRFIPYIGRFSRHS
jgi:protein-S-isoprenylcysteine O-methyltransferase Ste14